MKNLKFSKMVASGNDFVVIQPSASNFLPTRKTAKLQTLSRKICDRKFGIGADGLLLLEKSNKADIKMRIFNADGTVAEMCGNGARCAALYYVRRILRSKIHKFNLKLETKAGIILAEIRGNIVKVKLTDPLRLKLDIPLAINGKIFNVHYIDTGVPHIVFFCDKLDGLNILPIAREIRFHKKFAPRGANVNFVTVLNGNHIKIRTYERGVEDETLSCGTGSTAGAIMSAVLFKKIGENTINVMPASKEKLIIYFNNIDNKIIKNVWLEGNARFVFNGTTV